MPSMLEGTLPGCPSVGSACSPCMHTQLCQPACSDGEGFSCSLGVAVLWVFGCMPCCRNGRAQLEHGKLSLFVSLLVSCLFGC